MINTQTLRCSSCGSAAFDRLERNEYRCTHCNAVTLVEDDVAIKLERVLEQVKNAAAQRLITENRFFNHKRKRIEVIIVTLVFGLIFLILIFNSLQKSYEPQITRFQNLPHLQTIASEGLRITDVKRTAFLSDPFGHEYLFAILRNETGHRLDAPTVTAELYNENVKLTGRSAKPKLHTLMPGDVTPVLIEIPSSSKSMTRYELKTSELHEPYQWENGPKLFFDKMRLIQQDKNIQLIGKITNTQKEVLSNLHVVINLYNRNGKIIGLGEGYGEANELQLGESTFVSSHPQRIENADVAAYDYLIEYNVGQFSRKDAGRIGRVVRIESTAEILDDSVDINPSVLLADNEALFDTQQLEITPVQSLRDETQRRVFFTEVINHSTDTIALRPTANLTLFNVHRQLGNLKVKDIAYLYPGERLPLRLDTRSEPVITHAKINWNPILRKPLPGPRKSLNVTIDSTQAGIGSVNVNFTNHYDYKYVDITGTLHNPGSVSVSKTNLWVCLRDVDGQLSGFSEVKNISAIRPGESLPFEVSIKQFGKNFTTVTTHYEAE